jgi:hypothetical protein
MKTVLVPVEQHAVMRPVLDVALLVARQFGSHIEGLALGPDIPETVALISQPTGPFAVRRNSRI